MVLLLLSGVALLITGVVSSSSCMAGDLSLNEALSASCHAIGGNLLIINTQETSLLGLSALTRINGSLVIAGNDRLASLAGLESLQRIGDRLQIIDNQALKNLSGLSAFTMDWHHFLGYQR
jgi:hypothetical protein